MPNSICVHVKKKMLNWMHNRNGRMILSWLCSMLNADKVDRKIKSEHKKNICDWVSFGVWHMSSKEFILDIKSSNTSIMRTCIISSIHSVLIRRIWNSRGKCNVLTKALRLTFSIPRIDNVMCVNVPGMCTTSNSTTMHF